MVFCVLGRVFSGRASAAFGLYGAVFALGGGCLFSPWSARLGLGFGGGVGLICLSLDGRLVGAVLCRFAWLLRWWFHWLAVLSQLWGDCLSLASCSGGGACLCGLCCLGAVLVLLFGVCCSGGRLLPSGFGRRTLPFGWWFDGFCGLSSLFLGVIDCCPRETASLSLLLSRAFTLGRRRCGRHWRLCCGCDGSLVVWCGGLWCGVRWCCVERLRVLRGKHDGDWHHGRALSRRWLHEWPFGRCSRLVVMLDLLRPFGLGRRWWWSILGWLRRLRLVDGGRGCSGQGCWLGGCEGAGWFSGRWCVGRGSMLGGGCLGGRRCGQWRGCRRCGMGGGRRLG